MLEAAGLIFEVAPADLDETAVKADLLRSGTTPSGIAQSLAVAKAQAVSAPLSEALVIGADQVLACGGQLFDKPASMAEAREQLLCLRGKSHQLHAGVALAARGKAQWARVETATLVVRAFSDQWLAHFLAHMGERVLRTVGAYEIEGPGIQLFERVEGDMFTIIGLPLLALLGELRARGAIET
jgi:septum formation protein